MYRQRDHEIEWRRSSGRISYSDHAINISAEVYEEIVRRFNILSPYVFNTLWTKALYFEREYKAGPVTHVIVFQAPNTPVATDFGYTKGCYYINSYTPEETRDFHFWIMKLITPAGPLKQIDDYLEIL